MPPKKNKNKASEAANDDIDAILAELDAADLKKDTNTNKKGKGLFFI